MLSKNLNISTRKLSITALMSSICIIMSITPLGYLPTPGLNITLMHIPVIVSSIVEGPLVGMFVGAVFGVTSLIRALMMPTPLSFVFYNPLVSVLPRILIGLISGHGYKLMNRLFNKNSLSYILSAILGTITNTVGVLSMIYIIYADKYLSAINNMGDNPLGKSLDKILLGVIATNMLPEIITGSIFVFFICNAINKIYKKNRYNQ